MEIDSQQQHRSDSTQSDATKQPVAQEDQKMPAEQQAQETEEVAPGIPIVRSNTPRPFSFNTALPNGQILSAYHDHAHMLSTFPTKAPSAPPLPEELDDEEENEIENESDIQTMAPLAKELTASNGQPPEFVWLFEYGLEMDPTILNSPEYLDGLALLYGPAVLKGYRIMFGTLRANEPMGGQTESTARTARTFITMMPANEPDTEIWGVLYRVPRRLTEDLDDEPSPLDTAHAAASQHLYTPIQVVVHEIYRDREVVCTAYAASVRAQQLLHLTSRQDDSNMYVQRLTTIARRQKLPDMYIKKLVSSGNTASTTAPANSANVTTAIHDDKQLSTGAMVERDTEPLALPLVKKSTPAPAAMNPVRRIPPTYPHRWLMGFALYLLGLLLIVLTFAVLQGQGIGSTALNPNFMLLDVPWLVLVYGLLGGCVSSIVTLSRSSYINPPAFVIITWFTRPFIGAVLALFAYLLLNSGIFVGSGSLNQHSALFLFVGAVAGLCESWLFLRKDR